MKPEQITHDYKRGYANGYSAALNRLKYLQDEIVNLRQIKTPLQVDMHDATIEYLLTTCEALTTAVQLMIEVRTKTNPPNDALVKLSQ